MTETIQEYKLRSSSGKSISTKVNERGDLVINSDYYETYIPMELWESVKVLGDLAIEAFDAAPIEETYEVPVMPSDEIPDEEIPF